jgi:putative ABC transport system permease protein
MNIQLSDLSLWGIILMVFTLCAALALLALNDRRIVMRVFRVFVFYVLSLSVVTLCMFGLYWSNSWWVNALWCLLMSVGVSYFILYKNRLPLSKMFLPVLMGVMVGLGFVLAVMHLTIPVRPALFVAAVTGIAAGLIQLSLSSGLKSYVASLRYTKSHYQYLQANGASRLETLLPSVRRGLRGSVIPLLNKMIAPIVIAPPVFMMALLLMGVAPVVACVLSLVLFLTAFASSILSLVVTLLLSYRSLFDHSGRLILES